MASKLTLGESDFPAWAQVFLLVRCLRQGGRAHLDASDLRVHIPTGHCEGGFCKTEAPGKNSFQFPSRLEDSDPPHSKGGSELGRELSEMAAGPNLFPSWERLRGGLEPDCQTFTGNPFFRYTSTRTPNMLRLKANTPDVGWKAELSHSVIPVASGLRETP